MVAAFDLATGISVRARDYAILQGRYSALLAELIRVPSATDEGIKEWQARRVEIEAEEPPIFWAIEADCDNEICLLKGHHDRVVEIPWWRLAIGHYFRQDGLIRSGLNAFASERGLLLEHYIISSANYQLIQG